MQIGIVLDALTGAGMLPVILLEHSVVLSATVCRSTVGTPGDAPGDGTGVGAI
jgi:hypothetical protein